MTTLTFYGGINEVGGNKILLEDKKTKLWLDFGMSFRVSNYFFDDFMNPRKINGVNDFIEVGLVPWLKGLYRNDYVKRSEREASKPLFDGVLLSHPHFDHFGHFDLLHPEIPLHMGECTKLIIQAIEESGSGMQFLTYREAFTGLHHTKNPKINRPVHTFRTGKRFDVGDMNVIPHHVDHSIPGAYGYVIETSKGAVVYTGDLRMHGRKGFMTKDFAKFAAKHDPEALIIEGTRLGDDKEKREERRMGMTEEQVKVRINSIVSGTKQLVVANFPPRDMDRFMTFYETAKENDRKLIIDMKQAYLLKLLGNDEQIEVPKFNDKHLQIYLKRMNEGIYAENDYNKWARPLLEAKNLVKAKEIEQNKSIFFCNAFSFCELIDIKPKEGSNYIYSLCEPFNDEMELDMERVKHWLEHFKLPYNHAHASGHSSKEEIMEIIEIINAKKVFGVHGEHWMDVKTVNVPKIGEKAGV